MCIFAGPQRPTVYGTKIFGQTLNGQATVVYALELSVASEVAMILPVPIVIGSGDDALAFESLEGYPRFFHDMERGFPMPLSRGFGPGPIPQPAPLKVHAVGAYEASFVPHLRDFHRLDARFRLSDRVWQKLPQYADYGFAVFRLAPGTKTEIHPMAFRFPTRHSDRIFFPTVHVHDGEVHATAQFSHALYYQTLRATLDVEWGSSGPARDFMSFEKVRGLVDTDRRVFKRALVGELPNRDFSLNEAATQVADLYLY